MTENNQFYADDEKDGGVDVSQIDLSIAYEIKPKKADLDASPVVFFCRDCRKLVPAKKAEKKLKFSCEICGGKKIVFGTKRALENHFHLNSEGVQKD